MQEFSEPTRAWFGAAFAEPTTAQTGAWEAIAAGRHALVVAPTGSGKTLSAFLWSIDRLLTQPPVAASKRCRVLYVSPLTRWGVPGPHRDGDVGWRHAQPGGRVADADQG